MAAISPLVAIGIGLAAGWMWRERSSFFSKTVMIALVIGWAVTLHLSQGYWGRMYMPVDDPQQILVAAQYIDDHTQPNELVALAGDDWDPSIFYYARREGLMVRGNVGSDQYPQLRSMGYTRLFFCSMSNGSSPTTCSIVDLTGP
jgi:hypothetical protein